MRDLYDRTRHKDLAAPEVRRAASTAAPTACVLAVVGFSPIGRDGTRWGDCFRLGWGRSGFRDSGFCNLACACVLMGFGLRSGDAALQGGRIEFD